MAMDRTPRWVTWWGYSGTTTLDILAMLGTLGYLDESVKINLYYVPRINSNKLDTYHKGNAK